MDLMQAREQKRQRIVTNRERLANTKKDMSKAGEVGERLEGENLSENKDYPDAGVLVTDDDCHDDEDIEGDYDRTNSRVTHMERLPNIEDEIDYAVMNFNNKHGDQRTSLFTYVEEGEWSKSGDFVQLISVEIVGGSRKYLFGKILARNYRDDVTCFYNRDSNNCELLDEKAVATLDGHQPLQIYDEIDIYFDLSIKDSEHSEARGVGRGKVAWHCLKMRPGIFSDVVRGEHSVTRVTYAVIFDAVEAVVGVKIIGRLVKNLRAKVVAISEKFGKIVLFSGMLGDVLEEESIPLWNSVVAVSKEEGQKLKIRVSLGGDEMGKTNHYSTTFNPKLSSCDKTNHKKSKYGILQVKVAWSAVPLFPEQYMNKLHDAKPPS